MRNWPWGLLSGMSALITGCAQPYTPLAPLAPRPIPAIDAEAPTTFETATFALG